MFCIRSSKPRVLWNGSPLQEFSPSCGLRQGDPFSPYIFILCMERLVYSIEEALVRKTWDPNPACQGGPRFSHIFFADDLILMARATRKNLSTVKTILKGFCDASGLMVNRGKSKVFFAKCTKRRDKRRIAMELGFGCTENLGKYLGVPITHGRASPGTYRSLIDRVQSRLSSWKAKLLNFAGRLTLVKSVMAALPIHTMQSAWLPQGTCNHLDKLNRVFLWATCASPKKFHSVKWETVIKKKDKGGLGI
ncbi:hypothetical protein BUALT_Bualt14G0035300 [Buddleja alternifolia]|uniref:Reverse transcriptase domain-containing protein n=1 Tax=Buddleja alternifolia TaxID=168488 RepID=A0AAV6WNM3_9LAMI|nr:hypothetical protein BUALT_Bualt14G0035300 [Buddleja alternifolia]